ncbi:MAG: hypothetical protein IPJ39_22100 [Saprospiraceae bacterium]|nr:hypothetical protein [Saprospiraceae bacterium]
MDFSKNDYVFGTLKQGQISRDIIKWAYEDDTNVGDVSPSLYTYADENLYYTSKQVIAALKSIDKAGPATVESVRSKKSRH